MAGLSLQAQIRHAVVRRGERPSTAVGLPLLRALEPACAPLWRLFDGQGLEPTVRRQAQALCVRCAHQNSCSGVLTR